LPNHVIRDRIWQSDKLAACSRDAALGYPWVFLIADDWGRFELAPRRIWATVFGGREAEDVTRQDVASWLNEYEERGLLIRYAENLAVWTNFQGRPPSQRRPSAYPDPREILGETLLDQIGSDQIGSDQIGVGSEGANSGTRQAKRRSDSGNLETPEHRAAVDAYNASFGTRIGYTPGNLRAAHRAYAEGYTLDLMRATFDAVKARATATAAWCMDHQHEFEFLIRPTYKHHKTHELVQAMIDKIHNELATKRKPDEGKSA
jgi:hypothetical protein